MTIRKILLIGAVMIAPALVGAQIQGGLDPGTLLKPLSATWPTYSGDYTGRRFSALNQANKSNVKGLTLAWIARVAAGQPNAGGRGGAAANLIVGGVGTGEFNAGGASVKGAVLAVDDHL